MPIVVIAFLLVGLGDFVHVTFSGEGSAKAGVCAPYGPVCWPYVLLGTESIPSGANVTVHWTALPGGAVQFYIAEPNQAPDSLGLCYKIAGSGTCQFNSSGGEYRFYAFGSGWGDVPQSVSYTGSYNTSPLLLL